MSMFFVGLECVSVLLVDSKRICFILWLFYNVTDMIVDMDPSGLEAFSLDYKVDWPVGLVINRYVIERYQMIFRHLFYCRHVERHLCS